MGLLRLLLALCVFISHSKPLFGLDMLSGHLAVQSFFMISGFYMALVLNEKYTAGLSKVFYFNRLLRLLPVYLIVLGGTLFLEACFPSHFVMSGTSTVETGRALAANPLEQWKQDGPRMERGTAIYLALTNLTTVGQESTHFFSVDNANGTLQVTKNNNDYMPSYNYMLVPQAWSIGVEILFYLAAPFIVRRGIPVILSIIVAGIALRLLAYGVGFRGDPWNYRIFPLELCFFLMGSLGYKFYHTHKAFIESQRVLAAVLMLVTFGLIFCFQFLPVAARTLMVFFSVAVSIPFLFGLTRKNKIDRYLGEMSYPFYLTHIIVLMGLPVARFGTPAAATVTLVASMGLYHAVDAPIDRMRQRYVRKKLAVAAASTSILADSLA